MSSPNDFNQKVIEEFRTNGGKVGGYFQDTPLLLLTTTGAKSGLPRIAPLAYVRDGDHLIIMASKAGAPTHPDWYHNLLAHPTVTVEVGSETFQARANVAEGKEHQRLFEYVVAQMPGFGEYQQKTTRVIPVIVLERIDA